MNQMVRSPRRTSARSCSGQLATRYFVLYLGWIFERFDMGNSDLEPTKYTARAEQTCGRAIHVPTPSHWLNRTSFLSCKAIW